MAAAPLASLLHRPAVTAASGWEVATLTPSQTERVSRRGEVGAWRRFAEHPPGLIGESVGKDKLDLDRGGAARHPLGPETQRRGGV